MKTNILYLPLNKKETLSCSALGLIYLALGLLLVPQRFGLFSLIAMVITGAAIFLTRDFWKQTFFNASLLGKRIWLRPILAALLNLVLCTCANDILLFYEVPYFVSSGWGPVLWNVRASLLASQSLFWPTALVFVLILPIAEQLIFQQLLSTLIYPKSRFLTGILFIALFTAFQCIGFVGMVDRTYWIIYAFQFIPMSLFLYWMYHGNDSILSPIVMHMLCNALVVRTALNYMT